MAAIGCVLVACRNAADLPDVFRVFAELPDAPAQMDPAIIAANRDRWIEEWTQIVLR